MSPTTQEQLLPIKTLLQRDNGIWIVRRQQLSGIFNCVATFDMSTSVCKCLIACVYVWETATSAVFLCGYLLNDASREEWDGEKNLIPICWLDIGLLWLKNVNGRGNYWGEEGLRLTSTGQNRIKQTHYVLYEHEHLGSVACALESSLLTANLVTTQSQ